MKIFFIISIFALQISRGIMSQITDLPLRVQHPDEICFIGIRHGEGERNHRGTNIQGWVNDEASFLNEEGKHQADTVGRALAEAYPGIATFYTSDLHRCVETTERIVTNYLESLGETSIDPNIIKTSELREINHGIYDTMSYKKRNEFCKKYYEEKLSTEEGKQELIDRFHAVYPDVINKFTTDSITSDQIATQFLKWGYNPMQEIPLEEAGREPEYAANPSQISLPETIMNVFLRTSAELAKIAQAHSAGETIAFVAHAGVLKTLAIEAESRQNGNIATILPNYYESSLPGSKITSGNCSCQVFYYNKKTGELRFEGGKNLAQVAQKV